MNKRSCRGCVLTLTGSSECYSASNIQLASHNQRHESETEEEDGDKPSVSYEDMLRTKYPDAYEKLQKEELGFLNESWRKY